MSRRPPIPGLLRLGLYLTLLVPLATATGCTHEGGAIGAGAPRSEPMKVGLDGPLPAIGEEISLLVTRPAGSPHESLEPVWLKGRYLGIRDDALLLKTNGGERAIALGSIRKLVIRRASDPDVDAVIISVGVVGGVVLVVSVFLLGAPH
jgi:hypothetical protein